MTSGLMCCKTVCVICITALRCAAHALTEHMLSALLQQPVSGLYIACACFSHGCHHPLGGLLPWEEWMDGWRMDFPMSKPLGIMFTKPLGNRKAWKSQGS